MRLASSIIYCLTTAASAICILVFAAGCGTSSSYSVHTIPQDITGTWQGTAESYSTSYDLALSFVQTSDVTVVVYTLDDDTGTITGSYNSGSLDAGNGNVKLNLLFLMNTATGTLTIGEDELAVNVKKQQN